MLSEEWESWKVKICLKGILVNQRVGVFLVSLFDLVRPTWFSAYLKCEKFWIISWQFRELKYWRSVALTLFTVTILCPTCYYRRLSAFVATHQIWTYYFLNLLIIWDQSMPIIMCDKSSPFSLLHLRLNLIWLRIKVGFSAPNKALTVEVYKVKNHCTVPKYIGWLDGGCAVEIFCDVWCCSAHEDIICMATALFYGFDETTTVNLGHKITLYSQPKKIIVEEIWYGRKEPDFCMFDCFNEVQMSVPAC